jgi:hypothetical protein
MISALQDRLRSGLTAMVALVIAVTLAAAFALTAKTVYAANLVNDSPGTANFVATEVAVVPLIIADENHGVSATAPATVWSDGALASPQTVARSLDARPTVVTFVVSHSALAQTNSALSLVHFIASPVGGAALPTGGSPDQASGA